VKIAEKCGIIHAVQNVSNHPTGERSITINKILILIFSLAVLHPAIFGQDTLKNFHPNGTVSEVFILKNKVRDGIGKIYDPKGNLISEIPYISGRVEGVVKNYYSDGSVKETFQIVDGRRTGVYEKYDSLGQILLTQNFYNGAIKKSEPVVTDMDNDDDIHSTKYDLASVKLTKEEVAFLKKYKPLIPTGDPAIYDLYDEPARFLRGEEEFYSRLFYPSRALEDELEGTVVVRALINTEGKVEKTDVIKSLGLGCDESAAITVRYTDFLPAKLNGREINAFTDITVNFKLPSKGN